MEVTEIGGGSRMNTNTFSGALVRLTAFDIEKDAECIARWNQNSEYQQLLDSGPSNLWSAQQIREWIEKNYNSMYAFSIHTLTDDRIIGNLDLNGIEWAAGNAWIGIGIGEPEFWGKGYGREAMQLIMRYGFEQLNLKRISLTVYEYNQRGYRLYLKLGFREEGRLRKWMQRSGERYDLIFMGILREEWEAAQDIETKVKENSGEHNGQTTAK
jgi:RimJ/RimL family protein N-acetyltransferase